MKKRSISSEFLSDRQIQELVLAIEFGSQSKHIFNCLITVNLEQAGVAEDMRLRAIQALLAQIRTAARYRGGCFSAIWVRERAKSIGEHVHILAHIPDVLQKIYKQKYRRWLKAAGIGYTRGCIDTRRVWSVAADTISIEDAIQTNIKNLGTYLLKGAHRTSCSKFGLSRIQFSGRIAGKRCGSTQNLGPNARKQSCIKQ